MAIVQPTKNSRGQSGYWYTSDQEPPPHCGTCRTERYFGMTHRVREKLLSILGSWSTHLNEDGMVTAVALLLMAVLALLGTAAVVVTTTDILIGGNYKVSEQAFYAAEAGVEEAKGRLRETAVVGVKITDTAPNSPDWKVYIGTLAMAQAKGFNQSSLSQSRVDRRQQGGLQDDINYVVEIKHKLKDDGTVMTTAEGNNIYIVTSTGSTANSSRAVQAELTRNSPAFPESPLYVESPTTVSGAQTIIDGTNACGSGVRPAITTTLAEGASKDKAVTENGGPQIIGPLPPPDGTGPINYEADDLDVDAMVNSLKSSATITIPASGTFSGQSWGNPDSCSSYEVVYFNTNGAGVKLTGQSEGCGLLLVDGDLEVNGGFNWRGVVIATGSITFSGKGGDTKKVIGGMISGGSVDADVTIGGSAEIRYCSSVKNEITKKLPLRFLSWRDENQK